MADDELTVRFPDEAPDAPPPWRTRLRGWAREIGITVGALVLLMGALSWLRSPDLPAQAPDFTLASLDGPSVQLSELRGKTVVLNFWATWCGPCRMELPGLVSFTAEHPDVPVLFIAVDGEPPALREFAAAHDMPLAQVLRIDRATSAAYGVHTLPTTVVVEPDGSVGSIYSGMLLPGMLWWMTR